MQGCTEPACTYFYRLLLPGFCRVAALAFLLLTASGEASFAADFSNADLRGARLTNVDFRGSDLRGADLTGADLSGSDLRETSITQSQLDSACGDETKLPAGLVIRRCGSGPEAAKNDRRTNADPVGREAGMQTEGS